MKMSKENPYRYSGKNERTTMDDSDAMYKEAVQRAQSRALILQSLQANYQNEKKNQTQKPNNPKSKTPQKQLEKQKPVTDINSKKRKESSESSTKQSESDSNKKRRQSTPGKSGFQDTVDQSINILLKVADTSSDRNREYFKENISNKTIVLQIMKRKTGKNAEKANKMKRQQQGTQKLSNRQMKKKGLCNDLTKSDYSSEELLVLNQVFVHYLSHLVESCTNSQQLQMRLGSMEMIGAEVLIVDAVWGYRECIGVSGIVVGQSEELVFLYNYNFKKGDDKQVVNDDNQTEEYQLSETIENVDQIRNDENEVAHENQEHQQQNQQEQTKKQKKRKLFTKEWIQQQTVLKFRKKDISLAISFPGSTSSSFQSLPLVTNEKKKKCFYPHLMEVEESFPSKNMKELINFFHECRTEGKSSESDDSGFFIVDGSEQKNEEGEEANKNNLTEENETTEETKDKTVRKVFILRGKSLTPVVR
jgi:hypothetical protein